MHRDFLFLKHEIQNPKHPLTLFHFFVPSTFAFWSQSAHEGSTRLKISVGGFKSAQRVFRIQKSSWTQNLYDKRLKVLSPRNLILRMTIWYVCALRVYTSILPKISNKALELQIAYVRVFNQLWLLKFVQITHWGSTNQFFKKHYFYKD